VEGSKISVFAHRLTDKYVIALVRNDITMNVTCTTLVRIHMFPDELGLIGGLKGLLWNECWDIATSEEKKVCFRVFSFLSLLMLMVGI